MLCYFQACKLLRIYCETHNFNFKLKVSQEVPLISRFLAMFANSQVFSMETHGFDYTEEG